MPIYLLDHSLKVDVYYDRIDCEYQDNVCVSILESCPDEERIFLYDELNLYLTPDEARQLAEALLKAADESCHNG
jgi:hypothetical protein